MHVPLLLHPVASLGWAGWSVHPSVVIGLLALAGLYEWAARLTGHGPQASGHGGFHDSHDSVYADSRPEARGPRPRRGFFYSALAIIFAALNGPLHDLSDTYLFSAHMVQHLILTLLVPPLLIAGTPGAMLRPALRHGWVNAIARSITTPFACFLIFNLVMIIWHLPPMYNLAMDHHAVHIVQHLTFMVAAVLMWWPYLSPLPELPRLPYPGQMLYSFLMTIPMSVVAASIVYADSLLYPAYASAARITSLTPLDDQKLGGLIMWVPGGIVFYIVMTVVFFKWVARGEDSRAAAQVG